MPYFTHPAPALTRHLGASLLTCLALAGCKDSPKAPGAAQPQTLRYGGITLHPPASAAHAALADEVWLGAFAKGFEHSGATQLDGAPVVDVRWRALRQETNDGALEVALGWACSMEDTSSNRTLSEGGQAREVVVLEPAKTEAIKERYKIKETPATSMIPALTKLAKDCAQGLRIQRDLPSMTPQQVTALATPTLPLKAADKVIVKLAELEPVPAQALIRLLDHPHYDVVMHAMRVIVERKVLQADKHLVKLATTFSEARHMEGYVGTLFQLGRLGGPESRRYLEAVASGHNSEQIRDVAARALKGIK